MHEDLITVGELATLTRSSPNSTRTATNREVYYPDYLTAAGHEHIADVAVPFAPAPGPWA
ncbi:hypothetical protein [Kitasatospora sp. NPDC057500]|uniref:hypothetical protein n=1 Tax=Kitasatospora sp. NPDC057500 TaxID=3346151 RepID=UPI0036C328CA